MAIKKTLKISLDVSIVTFIREITPEVFARELSEATGKVVWKYETTTYFR